MTAEEHNKTLATLYFVYGAIHGLTLVALLLLVFAVQTALKATSLLSSSWFTFGAVVFVVVLAFVVGIGPIIVGYGFTKKRKWVKPFGTAIALVSMINIPVGTALGYYSLQFFRSEGGIKLYGGTTSTASESNLEDAVEGAKPMLRWSKRAKQER